MRIILALSLIFLSNMAHADDVLPTLAVQADPVGAGAKLKVGFEVKRGIPAKWIVAPFLQGTTEQGVATLFAIDSAGATASGSWELGTVISRQWWSDPQADAIGTSPDFLALTRATYRTCSALCTSPVAASNQAFCDLRTAKKLALEMSPQQPALREAIRDWNAAVAVGDPAVTSRRLLVDQLLDEAMPDRLTFAEYCPAGQQAQRQHLEAFYDRWSAVPTDTLSMGVRAGATVDKFLLPQDGNLTLEDETHGVGSLALLYVKYARGGTLEVPVIATSRYSLATTKTAKWCVSAGTVDEAGTPSDAQTCSERPIGPLAQRYRLQTGAMVGTFWPSRFWRLSAGPTAEISTRASGDSHRPYKFGLIMPLHIATRYLKKDTNVLARVTPGVFRSRAADGTTDWTVSFTIALFAGSSLFASPFDQF